MERRETISVQIAEIEDCIMKKLHEKYPYLKDKDVRKLSLESNTRFLLFKVVRVTDLIEDCEVKGIKQ